MKDRDQVISEHILKEDDFNHAVSHLGSVEKVQLLKQFSEKHKWDDTSKYRVALVMAPAWGVLFPPYNIAKLTGLLRHYGYSTKVYDLNIKAYHDVNNVLDKDLWRSENYYLWTLKEDFDKHTLPYIKPLLDNTVDELVEANPKVIGFSVYNTNLHAVSYLITELKKRLPDTCYVAGGPEVATSNYLMDLPLNYLFVGEAEETFIELLENLPESYPVTHRIGSLSSKTKLETLPFPDYSDYDFSKYQHGDGVSMETSRGCVAQCSFCAETYFWKFRSNTPERVVEEIEYQLNAHGVRRVWFVDSLINGNLKVFERIIDLIIEKKLDIKWNSYARCDGRMTKEFIKKIKLSGCTCLSYGVESGSQKVLNDMRKKIEVWEIENNLKHGSEVGLFNHVNWIIGFPTEDSIDFMHSLQLIANARKHIGAISPGFGAGPAQASHMQTDWKVYGMVGDEWIADRCFLDTWFTEDYKNTILHRFIRIKLFHIWLEILKDKAGSTIENSQRYQNVNDFFKFNKKSNWFLSNNVKEYSEYDSHVNLNRTNVGMGIANEYFALAYAMFKYFGSYELSVECDPKKDSDTFGSWLVNDYTANFSIKVDNNGNYSVSLTHTFNHVALDELKTSTYEREREREDKSFTEIINESGNFNSWKSSEIQTKETVHEQYRDKKKVITILPADE